MERLKIDARAEEILKSVDKFNAIHNQWASDDRSEDHPPASYWDALSDLFDVYFGGGGIPAVLRGRIDLSITSLRMADAKMDTVDTPEVPDSFWHAREAVEESVRWFRNVLLGPQPLQSVKSLSEEGVSNEQIAKMWNITNDHGYPESHLVAKELLHPGTVVTPDHIQEWEDVRYWKHLMESGIIVDGDTVRPVDPAPEQDVSSRDAPETWEDLFFQRVSADQAAKMKGVSLDVALRKYEELERGERGLPETVLSSGVNIAKTNPQDSGERILDSFASVEDASYDALKQMATYRGLEFPSNPKKSLLQDLIRSHDEAQSEAATEGA